MDEKELEAFEQRLSTCRGWEYNNAPVDGVDIRRLIAEIRRLGDELEEALHGGDIPGDDR